MALCTIQVASEMQEGMKPLASERKSMRVPCVGVCTQEPSGSEAPELDAVTGHVLDQNAGMRGACPSELGTSSAEQPPQRAKFRKMVNKIRAVNTFKNNKQVRWKPLLSCA